ncbi:MAG: hypothetical protein ASARMPREDX12_008488 [Alectoria sarmentosa]|nr:MAG: hypothetical protein ASARMPREDX12_008488 [Alectoria sarmentosa]
MVIPAPDPLSAVSSSITATITILEVTYKLKAVDEQTADLLSTTRHVDFMVKEAHRLRRLKAALLNTSERSMIDTVINDTEEALRAVAKLVEPCRVDKATKSGIRFGHRIMWVFRDNPSVRDKHQALQVCHQSLTVVFACLYSKDVVVIAPAPEGRSEEQPPPYDPQLKELLDWQNRRKGRKSLGERDRHTNEAMRVTKGSSNDTPVASPSSPCFLTVPLEDDIGTPSLSSHFSDMSFESPILPTPESQSPVPRNHETSLSPANEIPEPESRSPRISATEAYSYDEIRSKLPTAHNDACNNHASPMYDLPEIDSPPLTTMIAPYSFNDGQKDRSQARDDLLTQVSFSTWDQSISSSTISPDKTPSNTTPSPTLPFSAVTMPTSSSLSDGHDLGLKWLGLSRHNSYDHQEPTEASILGQHPLPARFNSDLQLRTTYQSDRLDAIARAEDVMTRENRAVSVGRAAVKRGGRSWLAYHATRSDMGQGMGWDG